MSLKPMCFRSKHSIASAFVFIACAIIHAAVANPVGPVVQPTAGPLGTSTGGTQSTIPAGQNDIGKNGTASADPIYHVPAIKAATTALAVLCAALTTTTYAILISPGTRLLSTSKLPFRALEANLGQLLSASWPDDSTSSEVRDVAVPSVTRKDGGKLSDAIRLFYAGTFDHDTERVARGVSECEGTIDAAHTASTPPMWLTTGSSLTKSMVQIAVWEWTSLWMAVAMLMSTLAFNGFLSNKPSTDSYPRLAVVLMYLVAYISHCTFVKRNVTDFFTLVGAGASWSNLHKAGFVSVELPQLERRLQDGRPSPTFKQIGKPSTSSLFPVAPTVLLQDAGKVAAIREEVASDVKKSESDTVAAWMKRDVTTCVEAGNSALNFVITNVMAMLGITITTGFSVWTSTESSTTSQLGSMALLASLTLAVGAMFSSAIELSVVTSSFRNLLMLKEVMINGEASSHVSKRTAKKRIIGFGHNSVVAFKVGMRELFRHSKAKTAILWGPAFVLLPTKDDHNREIAGSKFELHVAVRERIVTFTTENTSRHMIEKEDSVGTINVCLQPDTVMGAAHPAQHGKKVTPNVSSSQVSV